MEIIKPTKKMPRRKSTTPYPSQNLDFSEEHLTDETINYSSSDDELKTIDFSKICNKRRNDTPAEVPEPLNKRIRIDEYCCGCCDFVCQSNIEIHNHFANCPQRMTRDRDDLTPAPSLSSDFSDL